MDWLQDPAALLAAAELARQRAYAPYSNFAVGAALLTVDQQQVLGANVESVSYGLTMCAERNAIGHGIVMGVQPFAYIGMVVVAGGPGLLSPCGACRQVLWEFVSPKMPIWLSNVSLSTIYQTDLGTLLPQPFSMV